MSTAIGGKMRTPGDPGSFQKFLVPKIHSLEIIWHDWSTSLQAAGVEIGMGKWLAIMAQNLSKKAGAKS